MKHITLVVGIIGIIVVTIFNFYEEEILGLFEEETMVVVTENDYLVSTTFNFLENYTDDPKSKQQLINYIYYVVNSGSNNADGTCDKSYTNCIEDLESIANNTELLSLINNFVHPYNSFNKIKFTYNDDGEFHLDINKVYTEDEINLINDKVKEIIENNISTNMNTYDKVKTIHNYIIDNTEYDTLKTTDIKDTTYHSNTAYGPLIEGYGICSGYSDAMSIFLYQLNIDNLKVSNESHIWNLVKVGGKWLHLDLTWDDPIYETNINRDTYFLIDYSTLSDLNDGTHNFDHNIFSEGLN